MKFKIHKQSATGKQCQAILDAMKEAKEQTRTFLAELSQELGVNIQQHYGNGNTAGGVVAIVVPKDHSLRKDKAWRSFNSDAITPRLNTQAGKQMSRRFKALPSVHQSQLGMAVGFNDRWKTVGFNWEGEEYFLLNLMEGWEYAPPADVIPIKESEYWLMREAAGAAEASREGTTNA